MNQKPNLDLISMVQQARMAHDASAQPSQINAVYWIEAKAPADSGAAITPHAGYFVISTTSEAVDTLWAKIKQATEAGSLGHKSKVSTRPDPGQTDPQARMIHVRTANSTDEADVERVRAALQQMGIAAERYESDQGSQPGCTEDKRF